MNNHTVISSIRRQIVSRSLGQSSSLDVLLPLKLSTHYCQGCRDDYGYLYQIIIFYANNQVVVIPLRPRFSMTFDEFYAKRLQEIQKDHAGYSGFPVVAVPVTPPLSPIVGIIRAD